MAPLLSSHSIKWLGLLGDWVHSGQDSTNRLVIWLMERWHKNWFWNTGNKRVNSKAGMILGFQFEENTGTLGKAYHFAVSDLRAHVQGTSKAIRHLHATSTPGSSGGGKSEAMTWGFGWWLWIAGLTKGNPWKIHQLYGFSFEKKLKFPTKKDTKTCYPMGKSHSFCQLHPLAITFCIGTKAESQPKTHGGCRKFLLLFGRIGPLALLPCALLRAWGFLPHSINIL